jgi:hypothetical protein
MPWLAVGAGYSLYARKYRKRLRKQPPGKGALSSLAAAALLPVILLAGDLAKMAGYPVGVIEAPNLQPPGWQALPPIERPPARYDGVRPERPASAASNTRAVRSIIRSIE